MKRNRFTVRGAHNKKGRNSGISKYKAKVDSHKQLYGPGCCAHKLVVTEAMRQAALERRRLDEAAEWRARHGYTN